MKSSAHVSPVTKRNFIQSSLTWLACCASLASHTLAADASFIAVVKGQRFTQNGPDFIALQNQDQTNQQKPLVLEAFAESNAADSLVSGSLHIPGGATVSMTRNANNPTHLAGDYQTEDLLDLDTVRPNGTYTIQLNTKNDGLQTVSLNLTGDNYPPVSKITNFASLQSINASAATTIQWSPMTGGTTNDFMMLSISPLSGGPIFSTPGPGESGSLDGTATQVTIPTNTLSPGTTYQVELLCVKVVDFQNAYAPAIAGYYKMVHFNIRTSATPGQSLNSQVTRVIPANNSMNVGRDSAISFRFSQSMNPGYQAVTWSGTGINPADFSYQWTDNNRVLLCRYNMAFPANTTINWSLNLSGFQDSANFALSGTRSGSFQTSNNSPQSPPDLQGYYVLKAQGYRQTGTTPVATGMFGCDAGLELSAINRIKEPATLTVDAIPASGRLQPDEWDGNMNGENTFASKTDMDRFFPNGSFTFQINAITDGSKTLTVNLGTADDYPPAPTVTNLPSLQSINPASPTTITWNALSGWSQAMSMNSGRIEVGIRNDQNNEVLWIDNSELLSGSQCVIPAGALSPGRTYTLELGFIRIKGLNNTYGAWGGAAGFRTVTEMSIHTSGDPVMPNVSMLKTAQGVNLNMSGGESQRAYVIETSTDMQRWIPQNEQWIGDPQMGTQYYDSDAQFLGKRFYRLRDRMLDEQVQRHVTIQGRVWADAAHTIPAIGATISTNLDSHTTMTDSSGRFFLETDTTGDGAYSYTPYTIHISFESRTKNFGPTSWGDQPRNQVFDMQ